MKAAEPLLRLCAIASTLLLCQLVPDARAEHREVYGLSIPVAEVSKVGTGKQFKVVVGTEARIVDGDFLNEYIVRAHLFGASAKKPPAPDLFSFIGRAADANDLRLAALGLAALGSDDLARCLEQCAAPEVMRDVSREFLNLPEVFVAAREADDISRLLLAAAHGDGSWVRGKASRLLYDNLRTLREVAVDKFRQELLKRNLNSAYAISRLLLELLGESDAAVRELVYIERKLIEAFSTDEGQARASLQSLLSLSDVDQEMLRALQPLVRDRLIEVADLMLSGRRNDEALRLLLTLPFDERTPRVHELLRSAISGLSSEQLTVIGDTKLLDSASRYAAEDPHIARALQAQILAKVRALNNEGRALQARIFFDELRSIYKDPSLDNDLIRIEIARAFFLIGERSEGERLLEGLSRPLGAPEAASLFISGRYISQSLQFIAVFAPILAALLYLLIEKVRESVRARQKRAKEALAEDEEESTVRPQFSRQGMFVNHALVNPLNPRLAEYRGCLEVLGLTVNADLDEIKRTYRSAVKAAHPDMQQTGSFATERFVEITNAYDRLIQLRKEMGMPV